MHPSTIYRLVRQNQIPAFRIGSGNEILTIKEVCDLLQIHSTTLYKLSRQGKIPSFKIGADWRFTAADARVKLKRLYPAVDG